jgi:hypothetical protein
MITRVCTRLSSQNLLKLSLHTWLGDAQAANTKEIDKEEYTATQFVDTSTKTWGN